MAAKKRFSIVISAIDKATAPLKKTQRKIAAMGKSMQRVGRSMGMALTLPILAFGGFTIKVAADFEASMNRVRGITKATGEDFQRLREQAKRLGSTTQFTASQAAEAMEKMAKTGFDVEEIYAALPGVLELAASSGVELGEASELASGLLKGFGMEAKDMGRINDILVTTNLATNTGLLDIAETLKEIAPLARGMGLDLGEVAAAAGFMGDALLQGGRGGVALRNIMLSLTAATPEAEKTLQRLGIPKASLVDTEDNLTSLVAVVEQLAKAGATPKHFKEIFGKRGVTPIMALVGRTSEAMQELADKINGEDSVGEAARQAKIRMEGAAGAMLEFKSAVEGLQIAIGDSGLLGIFERITDRFTLMIQGWTKGNKTGLVVATVIAGIVAVIGPLMLMIGLAATAFVAFTAPVWIAIAAVMALIAAGAALVVYWTEVKAFFSTLWEMFSSIGKGIAILVSGIVDGIVGIFDAITSAPKFLLNAIGFGGSEAQLAGALPGGGSLPIAPPVQAEVGGQIGLRIESDAPVRVTSLETTGGVEIDVDSGPTLSGL